MIFQKILIIEKIRRTKFNKLSDLIYSVEEYLPEYFKNIDINSILEQLQAKRIVVITGFQGRDNSNNITTLGRGGSDTTAVAIAASLKAERCDIYTDVDGVFTTDPRIAENVKKIDYYMGMIDVMPTVANMLGHNNIQTTRRYAAVLDEILLILASGIQCMAPVHGHQTDLLLWQQLQILLQ